MLQFSLQEIAPLVSIIHVYEDSFDAVFTTAGNPTFKNVLDILSKDDFHY